MRKPTYKEAKARYERRRIASYARAQTRMAHRLGLSELRLAQIDAKALQVWREVWTEKHPSGVARWDWEELARTFRRNPAAFTLALWHEGLLCGLAAGDVAQRRGSGERAAVSIRYVQSIPVRAHPLKRKVVLITVAAAESYGDMLGASHVRVRDPLEGALPLYLDAGFTVVRERGRIVSCEKAITW